MSTPHQDSIGCPVLRFVVLLVCMVMGLAATGSAFANSSQLSIDPKILYPRQSPFMAAEHPLLSAPPSQNMLVVDPLLSAPLYPIEVQDESLFVSNAFASTKISTENLGAQIDQILELAKTHLPWGGWELAGLAILFFYKKLFSMIKSMMITAFVGIFLVTFLAKNTTVLQETKAQLKELVSSVVSSSLSEHMERLKTGGGDSPALERAKEISKSLNLPENM